MYVRLEAIPARVQQTGTSTSSFLESAGSKAFAALSIAYCAVGTMGAITPDMLAQREATSNWGVRYVHPALAPIAEPQSAPMALEPTAAQDLARIRQTLNPTVLELANLFGVSRQAVYDWKSGAQPSPQISERLAVLARAADVFADAGVEANTQTLRRKMSGGITLLDAVLNGGDAIQLAHALVGTLQRESSQRERMAQQLLRHKRAPASVSDYGAPGLTENT